jgi:hypothetical protein
VRRPLQATFFAVAKIGGFLDPKTLQARLRRRASVQRKPALSVHLAHRSDVRAPKFRSRLQLPAGRANMAYLSDAISTIIGASLGVSTVVTYIESATGVRDGGRTGLTACFSGLFFLMCLPFSPWLSQVPALASGPALVVVGVFMMEAVKGIDWCVHLTRLATPETEPETACVKQSSSNLLLTHTPRYLLSYACPPRVSMEDALPAFVCMIFMPLTFKCARRGCPCRAKP